MSNEKTTKQQKDSENREIEITAVFPVHNSAETLFDFEEKMTKALFSVEEAELWPISKAGLRGRTGGGEPFTLRYRLMTADKPLVISGVLAHTRVCYFPTNWFIMMPVLRFVCLPYPNKEVNTRLAAELIQAASFSV